MNRIFNKQDNSIENEITHKSKKHISHYITEKKRLKNRRDRIDQRIAELDALLAEAESNGLDITETSQDVV